MAIEIKQLVIRAIVEARRAQAPGALPARGQAAAEPVWNAAPPAGADLDREALIAECTRQVLRELRRGQGR